MNRQFIFMKNHQKKIIKIILCLLTCAGILACENNKSKCENKITIQHDSIPRWKVLPIRSKEEFEDCAIGGEAEQHFHGIARCANFPDYIYLSHDVGGVWRSADSGTTWRKTLDKGLSVNFGQSIESDPVHPLLIFIIVNNRWNWMAKDYQGLYRSEDGGDSWELVLKAEPNFIASKHSIYRHEIAYAPSSITKNGAQIWYAAFSNNGLYRSEDRGKTWPKNSFSSLKNHETVYSIKVHPKDEKSLYLASNLGLFFSNSKGKHFQKIGDLPSGDVSSIEINPENPEIIYATVKNQGLFKSHDGGGKFFLLKQLKARSVFINYGFPDTLYLVGVSQNMVISHDGGKTWIEDMKTNPFKGLGRSDSWKSKIEGKLSGIVPNPKSRYEAVGFSRATLWKTTDGGHVFNDSSTLFTGFSWSWWNSGVAFDRFDPDRFAFFNNDIGMTITKSGGNYFELRNSQLWSWYKQGLTSWIGCYSGSIQPVMNSKIIIASVGNYFKTQLMRSTDEGKSWEILTDRNSWEEDQEMNLFISFHPGNPSIVYAGNKISKNAGESFQRVDFGKYNKDKPSILGMCLSRPDTIYAMDAERSMILRSNDRGENWFKYSAPGWIFKVVDFLPTFAVHPSDPDKIYSIDAKGDLAVFNGKKWKSAGLLKLVMTSPRVNTFVRSIAIDPKHPDIIYASMASSGISCIWRSMDNGKSWKDITYNLPRSGMNAMAVNPHTGELFQGSCIGTWIFPPPYKSGNLISDKLQYPAAE